MLLDDRGILDGHRPAAELYEPGAVRLVPGEEGSPERGVAGHGAIPSRWGEASKRAPHCSPTGNSRQPTSGKALTRSREARPDIPSLPRKPRADLRSRLDDGGWSV